MRRLKKEAFTVIELMIVVVILGVLAAIAVPSYTAMRDAAYAEACRTNLSQLNSALRMYNIDTGSWPGTTAPLGDYLDPIPTCPKDGDNYTITAGPPSRATCPNGH